MVFTSFIVSSLNRVRFWGQKLLPKTLFIHFNAIASCPNGMGFECIDVRTLSNVATECLVVAKTIPRFKTHKGRVNALRTPEEPYRS